MIGASLLSFLSTLSGNNYCSFLFYSFLFAHTYESVIYPGNLLAFEGDVFEEVIGIGETFAFNAVGFRFLGVLLVDSILPLSVIFGSAVALLGVDTAPFMAGGY